MDIFWQDFEAVLIEYRVSRDRVKWYRHWAEMFARSQPVRLEDRTDRDVDGFLSKLRTQPNIRDWQVAQAADALRILYQIFYDLEWAHLKSWPIETAVPGTRPWFSERISKPDELPDKSNLDGVETRFGDLLEKIRNQIRVRRYSVRCGAESGN